MKMDSPGKEKLKYGKMEREAWKRTCMRRKALKNKQV